MNVIFWISFLLIFFVFVLGPCHIVLKGGRGEEEYMFSFRIALWKEILGYEWRRSGREKGGWMILLGRCVLGRTRPNHEMAGKTRPVREEKEEKPPRFWRKCSFKAGIARIVPVFRWLISEIHLCRMGFKGTAGTGDPALTGMLYGWAHAALMPMGERVNLSWTPVFSERYFQGCFHVRLRIIIWRVLWGLVRQGVAFLLRLRRCKRKRKGGDSGD